MPDKYIIDVDTGVDDAQAIMLALSRPDIDVVAITCVSGNIHLDQVCLNTLKVLTVCDRLDIPVHRGSYTPLVGDGFHATHYHGNDGLGDANLDLAVALDQVQKEHAVSALLRLVNEHPGEITLVALAPLTNIALALKQDPYFGKKLKKVAIMGGNTQGCGNSTLCGEFNFACDPDAAFVVLSELCAPIILAPWEINLTTATGQPWEWFDKWIETDTPKGRLNKAIVKVSLYKQREMNLRLISLVVFCIAAVAPNEVSEWYTAGRPDKALCKLCQCLVKSTHVQLTDNLFNDMNYLCIAILKTDCIPSAKRDIPTSCQSVFKVPETTVLQVCTLLDGKGNYTGFLKKPEYRHHMNMICAKVR